ncbi:MAG TPA: IS1634 family transposase [Candidatus Angelobacter sp.]
MTSTYIEGLGEEIGKAKYGYSRDQRFDCKQLVIARVITAEGYPLAYEVMNGNTSDRTTLRGFLDKIETLHGRLRRVWVMDRGIPTEAVLQEMRTSEREIYYLVGTPRSHVRKHEKKWLDLPWQKVRETVEVKLFSEAGELYVLAKSTGRHAKERAMRRKKLAQLLRKLRAMQRRAPRRDRLLLRIGAARKEAGGASRLLQIELPAQGETVSRATFSFRVDQAKLKAAELQDGHYLLRSNLLGEDPAVLWERYIPLTQIEAAFKAMKSELGIRPIYHQLEHRVEAHSLVAFLSYCLFTTLRNRLRALAPGLTPTAVLEKLATLQMLDVYLPTTDGRWLVMPRFTQPEPDQAVLLHKLKLQLPQQPPPRIKAHIPEFPAQALSV